MGWLWHWLGFDYGLGYGHFGFYNAWSGFGSDLGEIALVGGLITMARNANCEVHGCWRLGRHQTAARHKVCRKHHPDDHLTAQAVQDAHSAAQEGK